MRRSAEPSLPETRSRSSGRAARLLRVTVAAAALGLVVIGVLGYPLVPALLAAALLLYGVALWRHPQVWLVVLPAALPSFDLAPWTGWTAIEEPDFVALVTIAVLALRAPPRRADFALRGTMGAAVALAVLAAVVGAVRGLLVPGVPGGSDVLELEPKTRSTSPRGWRWRFCCCRFCGAPWRNAPTRRAFSRPA